MRIKAKLPPPIVNKSLNNPTGNRNPTMIKQIPIVNVFNLKLINVIILSIGVIIPNR